MKMDFASYQKAFADAVLHADQPVPNGVTTARGDTDATRFAVYRNNVFVGLTRALAGHFPVTERLVGKEFFAGMARAYAQDHKPASPKILEYGNDFPEFIAGFQAASKLDYLPDVARIEAAWLQAYHAADATPLGLAALSTVEPTILAEVRLVAHPSAFLVRSDYPVGSIWSAHQQEAAAPITDWRPQCVLIVRPEMTVNVHMLPPQDAVFASCLFNAATLGAAAKAAITAAPEFDFGAALLGLAGLGAFTALTIDEGDS